MTAPTLDKLIAGMKDLAGQGLIDLYAPVTPQAFGWLQERCRTKLERELPADLASFLQVSDGCQINDVTVLGSKGGHALVDHNVELRSHGGKWSAGQIVFATSGKGVAFVIDVDAQKCHYSDAVTPRFTKTFKVFPEILREIIRDQLGIKARNI
jgi:hypothetical protein